MARGSTIGQRLGRTPLDHLPTHKQEAAARRNHAARVILHALFEAGMTQSEIGAAIGMSQNAISRWACGKTTASATTITCLVALANERFVALPDDLEWEPPARDDLEMTIPAGGV
jgi:hypothetical protein